MTEQSAGETVDQMFRLNPTANDRTEAIVGQITEVDINLIDPDPQNPRKTFEPKEIEALAQSIDAVGLKQPITVRPHPSEPGRYMISFGERRFRAFKLLQRSKIPAIIGSNEGVRVAQIIENLQRAGVPPVEEAIGIAKLASEENVDQKEIARRLGVLPSHVSMCVKIAGMGNDLLEALAKRPFALRTLYSISLAPIELRLRLISMPDAKLTRSYIDDAVKRYNQKKGGGRPEDKKPRRKKGTVGASSDDERFPHSAVIEKFREFVLGMQIDDLDQETLAALIHIREQLSTLPEDVSLVSNTEAA